MKTLNRTLSLALVFALVFSLMSFAFADTTTTSTGYTDAAKITYNEAVAVTSAIGVINGMDTGAFDPQGGLTREQGAKIIAFLKLGPTAAGQISKATSSTFKDVAADRWSSGYIAYCVNQGILAGYGDGNFGPADKLTSCAWAKMLLGALGFKADVEGFTGASWAINVATVAVKAGINDSTIALSADTSINREQACQMAFLTLTATEVQYTGGTSVTVGGTTITTGATRGYVQNVTSEYRNAVSTHNGTTVGDNTMQFCEDHFSKLKLSAASTMDAFGRPANNWIYNLKAVAQGVTDTPVLTFTKPTTQYDVNLAIKNAGYTPNASVATYLNGATATALDTTATSKSTNFALAGYGNTIEIYGNTDGTLDRIVEITPQVTMYATGTIVKDSATTTTVDEGAFNTNDGVNTATLSATAKTVGFASANAFVTAAIAANTPKIPVLVTPVYTGVGTYSSVTSVAVPSIVSGTVTAYNAGSTITVDGKSYTIAKNGVKDPALTISSTTIQAGQKVTLVNDANGNVFYITGTSTTAAYAYVIDAAKSGFTPQAKLLMADGTVTTVTTAVDYSSGSSLIGHFVTYSANTTTSVYTLTDASVAHTGSSAVVTTGNAAMTLNGNSVYANSNTVFLVASNSTPTTYKAYKGIASVPSFSAASTVVWVPNATASTFADIVYLAGTTNAGTTTTTGTFVFKPATASVVTDSTGTYNVVPAVVNGAVTTAKVATSYYSTLATGVYASVTYDGDGFISGLGSSFGTSSAISGTVTKAAANGVIGLGSAYYGYDSSTVVYYVNGGVITASSIGAVMTDATDSYYGVVNASGVLTALYIVAD